MIITRRFWCCNARATKAIHVDVRTREGVSEAKAQANAEAFAARKLRDKGVWAMHVPRTGAPQFTTGPRR
jgi:hypothetical protein